MAAIRIGWFYLCILMRAAVFALPLLNPSYASMHSGTGLICEMVLVKKLKLEASGHECREQYS
jgi:hypothetical protein